MSSYHRLTLTAQIQHDTITKPATTETITAIQVGKSTKVIVKSVIIDFMN